MVLRGEETRMIEAFVLLFLCGVFPVAVFVVGCLWDELKEVVAK
jgi:hypothetical protein